MRYTGRCRCAPCTIVASILLTAGPGVSTTGDLDRYVAHRPRIKTAHSMINRILIYLISLLVGLGVCQPVEAHPEFGIRSKALFGLDSATEPDSTRKVIDEWLIGWSIAQANSVQETCEQDPGCNPSQYAPEAQPTTTFGWDGAENIEQTADWARGPRYWVHANGRRVLLYLEDNRVTGAYMNRNGVRTSLCRSDECYPS